MSSQNSSKPVDLLGLIASVIGWVVAVLGGFAVAGVMLGAFKAALSRQRQYSEASFRIISRGVLIVPLVFSYIFLPRAGFVGQEMLLSLLVVTYLAGVCFARPTLLRSFANILTALMHIFISIYYRLKSGKGHGKQKF